MSNTLNLFFWILGAGFLGFILSALFANRLNFSRRVFLLPYILFTSLFLFVFIQKHPLDLATIFTHNFLWGILVGILVSAFLVKNVFSQPASRQSNGLEFVFDIAWLGFVYGFIDALFLNVMPVLAVWGAFSSPQAGTDILGRIAVDLTALVTSLFVTLLYHLGYSEFCNKSVLLVLLGNALITLAFLVSLNPLGAILSHTAMHIAAVIRGPETTIQLPPHYQK